MHAAIPGTFMLLFFLKSSNASEFFGGTHLLTNPKQYRTLPHYIRGQQQFFVGRRTPVRSRTLSVADRPRGQHPRHQRPEYAQQDDHPKRVHPVHGPVDEEPPDLAAERYT